MVQIKHRGGEAATRGNYWNLSNGDRISMDSSGVLPGDNTAIYYKANPLIVLAASPILGLIYAAFLPFIGLAIVGKTVFTKLFGRIMEGLPRVATFNWSPSSAYLAGKARKNRQNKSTTEEAKTLDEAEKK